MLTILYLPLDDRPCNLFFPVYLANIAGIKLRIPPVTIWKDPEKLVSWFSNHSLNKDTIAIISLDQYFYGGLVNSRFPYTTIDDLQRLHLKLLPGLLSFKRSYLFSILPRTQNHIITSSLQEKFIEELKLYWQKGKSSPIFRRYRKEYFSLRYRNLTLIKETANLIKSYKGVLYVVGLDDLFPWGPQEEEIGSLSLLEKPPFILPGADELGMLLLARGVVEETNYFPGFFCLFSNPSTVFSHTCYENISIDNILKLQLNLVKCKEVKEPTEAQVIVFVNTPYYKQGEANLPFTYKKALLPKKILFPFLRQILNFRNKLIGLADLSLANGGDIRIANFLINNNLLPYLTSLAGWNTSANTLGTVIANLAISAIAQRGLRSQFSYRLQRRFLYQRILDDFYYQTLWRRKLKKIELNLAKKYLIEKAQAILNEIGDGPNIHSVSFPWDRVFEINFYLDR